MLTYRHALLADLPQIVAIYNDTIAGRMVTADTEAVSVASRMDWFAQHSPDFRPLWVMTEGERISAWLSFSSFYGRPAYNKTAELSVYVHSEFHRVGLATCLLSAALTHAPTIGVDTLLGFIFAHNEPSLKLFERRGFMRWGQLPGVAKLDGIERDLVILGRRV